MQVDPAFRSRVHGGSSSGGRSVVLLSLHGLAPGVIRSFLGAGSMRPIKLHGALLGWPGLVAVLIAVAPDQVIAQDCDAGSLSRPLPQPPSLATVPGVVKGALYRGDADTARAPRPLVADTVRSVDPGSTSADADSARFCFRFAREVTRARRIISAGLPPESTPGQPVAHHGKAGHEDLPTLHRNRGRERSLARLRARNRGRPASGPAVGVQRSLSVEL